jgi:copper homeostasis protein
MTVLLEIACFSTDSAKAAARAGADRIELCENAELGGTTPPSNWLTEIEDIVKCPVNVMIRPRGGNFVYSNDEFEAMKEAIYTFKQFRLVSGFVFGILKHDRTVDVERTTELVKLASPLPSTFHRAFDESKEPFIALEHVIGCGIATLLTSGTAHNAVDGCETLSRLVKIAGDGLVVMPGGGVRSNNIQMLQKETNAMAYHSSALVDGGTIASEHEVRQLKASLLQQF